MNTIQHACSIIKKPLESGEWQQGERLPSLGEMAKLCTVSRSTMWRAVKILQNDSLIHAHRGGSIIAGPVGTTSMRTNNNGKIWEKLKGKIGNDILTGAFTEQRLPLISKLAIHYHVSVITLKKALHQLVKEGLLVANGHRYTIPAIQSPRIQAKVVLISQGDENNNFLALDERAVKLVESFERECMRSRFECSPLGFSDRNPKDLLSFCAKLEKLAGIAGFVVNFWNPWEELFRKRWFDLFQRLLAWKVPLIVIDQSGSLSLPEYLSRQSSIRILRIAGKRAGEMVADTMIRAGHRHIAYLSPNFSQAWAQRRYEGLCSHCRQYGPAGFKVDLHTLNEIADLSDLVLELLNLDKNEVSALFRESYAPEGIQVMIQTLERIRKKKLLILSDSDPNLATIRSEARHLAGLSNQPHDPETYAGILAAMYNRASTYAFEIYLRPFFERVIKTSRATAWVCADDKTAFMANQFLMGHGKKVPGDISVIGFDDWPGDFMAGLSSYNFNMNGMIQQSLRMISDPKYMKGTQLITEVNGYVVERKTTRR
jgi:DNA-binding LacI/PurR family transcriptional regulator/DNA-binding transcriptional regulator YhcF (GntR family)